MTTRFKLDMTKIPYPVKQIGPLLTMKEVEVLVGVTPMTVHNWRKADSDPFPHRRISNFGTGVRICFPRNEVMDWLKRNRPARYEAILRGGRE